MSKKMMAYLREQPAVWKRILKERETLLREFSNFAGGRTPRRILTAGSGSSYNAAAAAAEFYTRWLGLEAFAVVPTRAEPMLNFLDSSRDLVFVLSQSGRSTSTLHLIETMRRRGFPVIGFTSDASSPIASAVDFHQAIDCGDETVGPKTKGMTASVLTLYLAGLTLARKAGTVSDEEAEGMCRSLSISFDAAEENIETCRAFCEEKAGLFSGQPHFTLISDGVGLPAAQEGALKLLETLYVPAYAYEFEEYLHGIHNTIAPGTCNLLFPSSEEQTNRYLALHRFCGKNGCLSLMVSSLPCANLPEDCLRLSGSGQEFTVPFETLLFSQMLSACGSEAKRIDCDLPRFPDFYGRMETKIAE